MCASIHTSYSGFGHYAHNLPILRQGCQGDTVRILQIFLYQVGLYYGTVNGHYCSQTEHSVRSLQRQIGIPSDGIVDERTWRAITRIRKILGY